MKRATASHQGEPIWALAVILGGWVAMRALMWEAIPLPHPHPPSAMRHTATAIGPVGQPRVVVPHGPDRAPPQVPRAPIWQEHPLPPRSMALPLPEKLQQEEAAAAMAPAPLPFAPPAPNPASNAPAPMRPSVAAAHQLMWMAAVANLPSPQELVGQYHAAVASPRAPGFALVATPPPASPSGGEWLAALPAAPRRAATRRWSADGWLLLREGGVPSPGSTIATYGAAQMGAVLRYHLAPASGFAPIAFVRGYAAINGSGERQAALGLSARPLPGVPVAAMVEVRASRFSDGTLHWRPAAMLVSEFAPLALPLGLRAETYLQGGYVGGSAATGFIDGQLKLDRAISHIRRGGLTGELRAGAGVWGGGQTGASRIDIGPSVSLGLTSGPAAARLAADWRFRVSGNATPTSGPALTISAGF